MTYVIVFLAYDLVVHDNDKPLPNINVFIPARIVDIGMRQFRPATLESGLSDQMHQIWLAKLAVAIEVRLIHPINSY